jgi:hypothetical protein
MSNQLGTVPLYTLEAGASPAEPGYVTLCAWCLPRVNILRLERREADAITIFQCNKTTKIFRNGTELAVSHGICAACRAKVEAA